MIGTQFGISNLVSAVLGATRARGSSGSGFEKLLNRWFQSRAVEASCILVAIGGILAVSFKVCPRCACPCLAPFKKAQGSAAEAPRLDSLPCSAESGQGHSPRFRLAPEPNKSINQTPNPLRGFGSLSALGAGYFGRWGSKES
jgi:hypothetical protein